jgi:hypothetical protein
MNVAIDTRCRSLLDAAESSGFVETLDVTDDSYVICRCCEQRSHADDLLVLEVHEAESESEASRVGSHVVVTCVICPTCTSAGTLVLGVGDHSSHGHDEILKSMLAGRNPLAVS